MLGNYEKRRFDCGEKVWLGHYGNLTNVLHWHLECELIRIAEGSAQIRIGPHSFDAVKGDCFFCPGEELHYILGAPGSRIDILIFERSVTKDITDRFTLLSPKLADSLSAALYLKKMEQALSRKDPLYREALETFARTLLLEIFRSCETVKQVSRAPLYNDLIRKINEEFSFITFRDAACYCSYSPSHFSKMFKSLSGMTFSDYLNIIRIENAIAMLRSDTKVNITSISRACGFTTIRNFNRVFRQFTGYSPRSLPEDFVLDSNLHISGAGDFDPTQENSVLVQNISYPAD